MGVVKAYQTRVGAGPFPTECLNDDGTPSEVGNMLQSIGAEVGVTTGRRRRCGWLDLILLRRSTQINGFTAFALTKLDILDTFPEIKVAVGYKLDGRTIDCPPGMSSSSSHPISTRLAQASAWKRIEVEYKTFPGWQTTTAGIRSFDDLPENCQTYIKFIEEFVEVRCLSSLSEKGNISGPGGLHWSRSRPRVPDRPLTSTRLPFPVFRFQESICSVIFL